MKNTILTFVLMLGTTGYLAAQDILIVADEFPAMEVLAQSLQEQEGLSSKIIAQTDLPESLSGFKAVVVYIHKDLNAAPEAAFIEYAQQGGKLLLLHHSISSGKRKNKDWFSFLGLELPPAGAAAPAYKYINDLTIEVVNLAPGHFITTHKVTYPHTIKYQRENASKQKKISGFSLPDTEVYLNHKLNTPRTILMGFKIKDESGQVWMQDRSAWCMLAGKGWVFYSQPGHTVHDFKDPTYVRILTNAVIYKP